MNDIDHQGQSGCKLGCWKVFGIVAITVLLGLGYSGYRWHQPQHAKHAVAAAGAYTELLSRITAKTDNSKKDESATDSPALAERVESFMQQYGDTTYGTLLALRWAKYWVEQSEYTQAATVLAKALPRAADRELDAIIRLRLAYLYRQLQRYDEALAVLALIKKTEQSWFPRQWEQKNIQHWWLMAQALRGHILQSQQDSAGAQAAYRSVLTYLDPRVDFSLLQAQVSLLSDDMGLGSTQP